MPINIRQKQSFKDVADIYVPVNPTPGSLGAGTDPTYPTSPTYTSVKCAMYTTPEVEDPEIAGRTKQVNIFVLDKFYFLPEQDMGDTYMIRLKTPGHPDYGNFWIVQGNAKDKPNKGLRRANYRYVYGKRGPAPFSNSSVIDNSGPIWWVAADSIIGLNQGDLVTAVPALAGPPLAASSGYAPYYQANWINGKPGIVFDGIDDYMTTTSIILGSFSLFLVVDTALLSSGILNQGPGYQQGNGFGVFNPQIPTDHVMYSQQTAQTVMLNNTSSTFNTGSFGVGTSRIISYVYNGYTSQAVCRVNGVPVSLTPSASASNPLSNITASISLMKTTIGASTTFTAGTFAEAKLYNQVFTNAQISGAELTLSSKYNISTQ